MKLVFLGCAREDFQTGSSADLVVDPRPGMSSKRKRSGLKVLFEKLLLLDLFSDDEPEVPKSGESTPANWGPDREVWPSEEQTVES